MTSHLTVLLRTVTSVPRGKATSGLTPSKPNTPPLMHHFSSCTGISWAPSSRRLVEDKRLSTRSPIGHQVDRRIPSLQQKNVASLQLFVTSTVIPLGKHIIRWRADKEGKFTGDEFKA